MAVRVIDTDVWSYWTDVLELLDGALERRLPPLHEQLLVRCIGLRHGELSTADRGRRSSLGSGGLPQWRRRARYRRRRRRGRSSTAAPLPVGHGGRSVRHELLCDRRERRQRLLHLGTAQTALGDDGLFVVRRRMRLHQLRNRVLKLSRRSKVRDDPLLCEHPRVSEQDELQQPMCDDDSGERWAFRPVRPASRHVRRLPAERRVHNVVLCRGRPRSLAEAILTMRPVAESAPSGAVSSPRTRS